MLPLLVGEDDFFAETSSFGGLAALPAHPSAATMEKVTMHLEETTSDGSIEGLRALLQQASGQPEPTVQAIVNSLLKFQGIKISKNGVGAHGHGHASVSALDLSECTSRIEKTVSSCMNRVGVDLDANANGSMALVGGRSPVLSRMTFGMQRGSKSKEEGNALDLGFGAAGAHFGAATEGGGFATPDSGGGTGGLYLSTS